MRVHIHIKFYKWISLRVAIDVIIGEKKTISTCSLTYFKYLKTQNSVLNMHS